MWRAPCLRRWRPQGADVAVVLPLYQKVKERFGDQLNFECYDYVDLAWRHSYCGLFSLERDGVTWYFLDNEQYFGRPELYGYMDDGERFGFFSRAVVRMLPHLKFWPEVIHCNDWQTALVPIYLKDDGVREERFRSIRTVLTIHNIEYQGRYGRADPGGPVRPGPRLGGRRHHPDGRGREPAQGRHPVRRRRQRRLSHLRQRAEDALLRPPAGRHHEPVRLQALRRAQRHRHEAVRPGHRPAHRRQLHAAGHGRQGRRTRRSCRRSWACGRSPTFPSWPSSAGWCPTRVWT